MLSQNLIDTYPILNQYMHEYLTDPLLPTDTNSFFNPNLNLPIFNSYLCLHT